MTPHRQDQLHISCLSVQTCIGVPDAERAQPQRLDISLTFPVPLAKRAAATDNLARTVDYHAVAQAVTGIAGEKSRKLIETLAEDLATRLLKEFALDWIEIEIRKFVLPDTAHVAYRCRRP